MRNYLFILSLACLFACQAEPREKEAVKESGWTFVYKHDAQGKQVDGSLDTLLAGIRNGYSVRVGWGWQREREGELLQLEHMAEPLFLSIIQGNTISAVIDAHPLLTNYIDVDQQSFREGGHIWQCVLTTNGTFNAQVHHRATGELLRDMPQRHRMTWFLDYPVVDQVKRSVPLYQ